MVGVAQLVEPRIVTPVVVGSNPIIHPIACQLEQYQRDGDGRLSVQPPEVVGVAQW